MTANLGTEKADYVEAADQADVLLSFHVSLLS
jgi:hypothetical protein